MDVKALVFDMDGTLLDTMPDLAAAANAALAQMCFATRTRMEMHACMGLGGRELIERVVPAAATPEQRQRTFEIWRNLYIASDYELTAPFDGIAKVIRELRQQGIRTAVLSNKFDAGVQALADRHFPGLFDVVHGDTPPAPRKPDPTSLLALIDELGIEPAEAAYVGDSIVDVLTARNAGIKIIGVSWGYDAIAPLPEDELDAYIHSPRELLRLLDIAI